MYHMVFNSILIVDIQKKIAKYQRFKEGVNVITSNDNHVGKSSIIKSLYYSLGAEVFYDDIWDKSTKLYITKFSHDNDIYTIARYNNKFVLIDSADNILAKTDSVMSELSGVLSGIFKFKIYLTNKKGRTVLAPPVYSFLPYYLDQDRGWGNEPFVSFMKLEQFHKNKRLESLYYHLNVYSEDTQKKQVLIDNNKIEIENKTQELSKSLEALSLIEAQSSYSIPFESENELDNLLLASKNIISNKITQLNELRDKMYKLEHELIQYEKQKQIIEEYSKIEKSTMKKKEYSYVCHTCPNCGYIYEDDLFDLVLSQYGMHNERFITQQLDYMIKQARNNLEDQKKAYVECSKELKYLEERISKKRVDFNSYLVARGMEQSITLLQNTIEKLKSNIYQLEKENKKLAKEMKNVKGKKEADTYYKENLRDILIEFGAWDEKYEKKLKITTPLIGTGTLSTKIILADYLALYKTIEKLNVDITRFPLVVDSPRTKEPSKRSSRLILDAIINMTFTKQTILATTNFDNFLVDYKNKDLNIIQLDSPQKALLNAEDYNQNSEIIDWFYNLIKN